MVSFENGKFILRRDHRLQRQSRIRIKLRRVVLIALALSFLYILSRRERQEYDSSLMRATYEAGVRKKPDTIDQGQAASPTDEDSSEDGDVKSITSSKAKDEGMGNGLHDETISSQNEEGEILDLGKVSLNKKYMSYLQTLGPMPKKVHMFFPDKDYYINNPIPFVKNSILSLKRLNPEWNVTVYDDAMIDNIIHNAAESNIIPKEELEILLGTKDDTKPIRESAHIVEKSDLARLVLMYTEGGFYLDVDRLVNKRIEDVIQPNTRLCLPTSNDANFCQDLMCTAPKNELFLSIIRDATNMRLPLKRRKGWCKGGALFEMGPVAYNKQVYSHVFGDFNYYDKTDNAAMFRELIKDSDGLIITKKETSCKDGLLVDETLPHCHERGDLYKLYDMKPWGEEVNAVWADEKKVTKKSR